MKIRIFEDLAYLEKTGEIPYLESLLSINARHIGTDAALFLEEAKAELKGTFYRPKLDADGYMVFRHLSGVVTRDPASARPDLKAEAFVAVCRARNIARYEAYKEGRSYA